MSQRVKVVLNHAGMNDLLHDPGVVAMLMQRMGAALAAAQSSAPVETGHYRDELYLLDNPGPSRARVQLVSGAAYGTEVEAHTGNLARALDAAGGELA